MFVRNYLFKQLWRNKRRNLLVLLGIVISTSLITGITFASDQLGAKKLQDQFDVLLCDFEVQTGTDFDGDFAELKNMLDPIRENYDQVDHVYGSHAEDYLSATINSTGADINWTRYEEQNFNASLFSRLNMLGIDEEILNLTRMGGFIEFENGSFSVSKRLSRREVYIDQTSAIMYDISKGDNITIGQFYRDYSAWPTITNVTATVGNLSVVGFFTIQHYDNFKQLFTSSFWGTEDSIHVLTSAELAYALDQEMFNDDKPERYSGSQSWMLGIICDHSQYDYLKPESIEVFYERVSRDIIYRDITKDFIVSNRGSEILDYVSSIILQYTLLIFAISLPVIILGGYLIKTNYFIVLNGRRREIGLLKCKSASKRQILTIFLLEIILLGVIGGLLGVLVGYLSAGYVLTIFEEFAGFSIIELYSMLSIGNWDTYLIGTAIGTVLSLLSGLKPIKEFSELRTVDALQKYNVETESGTSVSKVDWIILIVSLTSIIFSVWFDQSVTLSLPNSVRIFLEVLLPVMMAFMPVAPFLLTYAVVKFVCNYSVPMFSKFVSKITSLYNKRTGFFVSRSIIRNRARSTRLVFIIAMGLSFLLISDVLASSQTQFEADTRRIYFGADSNFRVYSYESLSNLSIHGPWSYSNYLQAEPDLNVSQITLQTYSDYVDILGTGGSGSFWDDNYDPSSFRLMGIDIDNYTQNIENIDKFILQQDEDHVYSDFKAVENAILVPKVFLNKYNYRIGDDVYVEYTNRTDETSITVDLQIVGSFDVLPGVDPISSEYDTMYLVFQRDSIQDLEISYYRFLVDYDRAGENSEFLSLSQLTELNENLIARMNDYDPSVYTYASYTYLLSESGFAVSMLNFLGIEKFYLLTLVTMGIGIIMYVSIQEKSIDFGVLRARGVPKKTIFSTQISEGAVFLTLGALISLISLFSAYALNSAVGEMVFDYIAVPRAYIVPGLTIFTEISVSIAIFIAVIYITTHIVSKQSDIERVSEIFRMA